MLRSSQKGTTKRTRPALAVLLGSASILLTAQLCQADLPSVPGTTATDWNAGPGESPLGTVADLNIPPGYKFMDASAAGALLTRTKQRVPDNLLGLLADTSEEWWIVLQFAEIGYVKDPKAEALKPKEILDRLRTEVEAQNAERKKQALPLFTGVEWALQPKYEPADHTLSWAVRKLGTPQPIVSHTVRLFCRRGAVDATVVRSSKNGTEFAPVDRLVKRIVPKAGERYEDSQPGDKACDKDLAALIINTGNLPSKGLMAVGSAEGASSASLARNRWVWIGGGVLACAGLLGGVLVLNAAGRRRRASIQRVRRAAASGAAPVPPADALPRRAMFTAKVPAPASSHPAAVKPVVPKLRPAHAGTNGKPANGKRHGQQRRKVFDYNRYFTDLMGAVSSHSTQMDMQPTNGVSFDAGTRPTSESKPAEGAEPAPAPAPSHHAQLMASQRDLIEEQKRLIQEQNKLIEEKTRLIAEKNALLKMQSQFMEDKLL